MLELGNGRDVVRKNVWNGGIDRFVNSDWVRLGFPRVPEFQIKYWKRLAFPKFNGLSRSR